MDKQMENKGLIFIPDISGFTRFVSQTEIQHSRMVIQELLETLIKSNQMGLEVSEIEGDAILFYRFGESPDLEVIYRQVEKMFCEFHKRLLAYEYLRFCHCTACNAAVNLSLKVITHYGEFTRYTVSNFEKLIGKDVIVAHQLLKNDIDQHEYWLVTPPLAGEGGPQADFARWMQWNSSARKTESGDISFFYTFLAPLKAEVAPELPELEISSRTKVLSFSREYDADSITLFHATGDFNYRSRWMEGVRSVEEVSHLLPRVGLKCRCVMDDGQAVLYYSSCSFTWDRIEFSETDEQKNSSRYFTLEKTGEKKTRLTIDLYVKKNLLTRALFALTKKAETESTFRRSLLNLESLVKEIRLPG